MGAAQRLRGNVIAELTTAGATVREYIWLPETAIAPTMQSRTQVDRPVAVVDGVNTGTPATLMVHVDHLNRPVRMTNSTKASVWDVIYTPWGAFHSATGAQTPNARFPGQWFQLESGLHYNWHPHYDPSLGRYTQPDPLGFVDGPSVYAYAGSSPGGYVDPDGEARDGIPRRFRDCNSAEVVQCFSQCAKIGKGMQSCKRSQMYVTLGTSDGETIKGWKDQGLSCSCAEPEPNPDDSTNRSSFQCKGNCQWVQKWVKDAITGLIVLTTVLVCGLAL